jgi:ABC-type multidrug transport system fused ATPase/permease subunit
VLDRGRIVEIGTYDELLDRGGRFAELVAGDQPLEAELA